MQWLSQHADTADKSTAARFCAAGVKYRTQRHLGPAGKAFSESALLFPQGMTSCRARIAVTKDDRSLHIGERQGAAVGT